MSEQPHPASPLGRDDIDASVRRADPDRWLASRFIGDPLARADVVSIHAFDHELARASLVTTNSLIAEIRLTWWREALDEIFAHGAVRRHPVAERLGETVRRRSLPRDDLEAMIDGRIAALDSPILPLAEAAAWASAVAGSAAVLAARILDPSADLPTVRNAGALWGLARLARSGGVDHGEALAHIEKVLPEARRASSRLSAKVFPAIAHVALVSQALRAAPTSPLRRQLRLVLAVATGRL